MTRPQTAKVPKIPDIKPNTVLPKGAKLVPVFKKSIGGWVEMEYNATVERLGLKWHRVKDGMGQRGDSEEWICDLPSGCINVHAYSWRAPRWGFERYNSFDEAVVGETQKGIDNANRRAAEYRLKADKAGETVRLLTKALANRLPVPRRKKGK